MWSGTLSHISWKSAAWKLCLCIQLWSAADSPALCAVLYICTDGDTVFFVHGAHVDVNPFTIEISKSWIQCNEMCSPNLHQSQIMFLERDLWMLDHQTVFFGNILREFRTFFFSIKGIQLFHFLLSFHGMFRLFQCAGCHRDSPFHLQTMRSCQAAVSISHVWQWALPCPMSSGCWVLKTWHQRTTCPLDGTSWSLQTSGSQPTTPVWPCQPWEW